ncbi:pancreatic triacylglycerol lipase-like [Arctopsyche grandis]|uniref:pancreatic triacylglycerol lipase-like n=1 Tax=Arctopsyche grandis TaxID=121162 RepID=UPI00406D760B
MRALDNCPPYVNIENSYFQLYPVDPLKCPNVDLGKYITFELYTRYNPLVSQELKIGDDKLLSNSYIDFSLPTMIYLHAFFEDSNTVSATLLRQAYMIRGDHNMIMVSSRQLYAGPWYITAKRNTRLVGTYAGQLINYLYSRGLQPGMLHLVGHSLGAQAAGVAGNTAKPRPARITGLDPALPLFQTLPLTLRLDRSDADFVDIIHTDSGGFGISAPMGHADFYLNGGRSPQPGCELEVVLPRRMILEKFFCSHWRSFQVYAESVLKPSNFPSVICNSLPNSCKNPRYDLLQPGNTTYMGFGVSPQTRGRFFARASPTSPYGTY